MKNKLFEYFCARTAFFAALLLLLPAFSAGVAEGQARKERTKSNQPEAVFTNPAPITIVDATGTGDNPIPSSANPYPSTINVSGLTGTIPATPGSIKVTLNGFSHTFPDDIDILLVGPTGAAFRFFSGVTQNFAANPNGNPASNITFTVSDDGATQLPNNSPLTAGTLRPAAYYNPAGFPAPGPGTNFSSAAPDGSATFASVFGGTNPNGNWRLFIIDFVPGDRGSISGGWTLEITTGGGGVQPFDNRLDFFGTGFSDWMVISAAPGGNIIWFCLRNDNPSLVNGAVFRAPFGLPTDQVTAFGDYTGDGRSDLNIWRPDAQGLYWILRSDTVQAFNIPWGIPGDITNSEGDYDGDGKLDPTVIREEGAAYRWYVLRSGTNTFSTFVYGLEATDIPLPGADYTGDGADDPTVVRINQASGDILWIVGNTNGGLINKVQWGNFGTDFIIPAGDYDGDSKADFVVWRGFGDSSAANGVWYILRSTGGVDYIQFGIPGDGAVNPNRDLPLRSGDYDGDDKTDVAVYRPSNQTFYVLRSRDRQLMTQKWGFPGDIPLARFGTY